MKMVSWVDFPKQIRNKIIWDHLYQSNQKTILPFDFESVINCIKAHRSFHVLEPYQHIAIKNHYDFKQNVLFTPKYGEKPMYSEASKICANCAYGWRENENQGKDFTLVQRLVHGKVTYADPQNVKKNRKYHELLMCEKFLITLCDYGLVKMVKALFRSFSKVIDTGSIKDIPHYFSPDGLQYAANSAAECGSVELLNYFKDKHNVIPEHKAIDVALGLGLYNMLKYAVNNYDYTISINVLKDMLVQNRINLLKKLFKTDVITAENLKNSLILNPDSDVLFDMVQHFAFSTLEWIIAAELVSKADMERVVYKCNQDLRLSSGWHLMVVGAWKIVQCITHLVNISTVLDISERRKSYVSRYDWRSRLFWQRCYKNITVEEIDYFVNELGLKLTSQLIDKICNNVAVQHRSNATISVLRTWQISQREIN